MSFKVKPHVGALTLFISISFGNSSLSINNLLKKYPLGFKTLKTSEIILSL